MAAKPNGLEIDSIKWDHFRDCCSMCLEPYAGRTPKLLPCFHTICLPCLTTLAESVTSEKVNVITPPLTQSASVEKLDPQSNGEEKEERQQHAEDLDGVMVEEPNSNERTEKDRKEVAGVVTGPVDMTCTGDSKPSNVFLCPTCRATVTVPAGGVSDLQTNFYIVMEPEPDKTTEPMLCQMCDEENEGRKEAEYSCDKCQQRMCRTCRRLHDKIVDKKEHQVKPLSLKEKTASSHQKADEKKCRNHQDQQLCLFCQDCDAGICLVCKLTSHQSHNTEDMAVAAIRVKEDIGTMVNKAKDQINVMQRRLTRLSRDDKEMTRQQQEAIDDVKSYHGEILHWADRARDELLEAISGHAEHALSGLKSEETSTHECINSLCGLVSRAASAKDNSEVLLLRNELQAALLEEEEFEGHKQESERTEHKTFLQLEGDSSAVDLSIVRAYFGEMLVGNGEEVPFVSIRDQMKVMEGKMESMKANLKTVEQGVETKLQDSRKHTEAAMGGKLEKTKASLSADLNAKVQELKTKMGTVAAFQAFGPLSITIRNDEKLVFDWVQTNLGNAFDKNSGVFKAPVSGLYCFQATLMTKLAGRYLHSGPIRIFLCNDSDGALAEMLNHNGGDKAIQSSISALVHMEKNKRIYLKNKSGNEIQVIGGITNPCTTFHGFLVKAD